MSVFAVLLSCLACASHGRRMQTVTEGPQHVSFDEHPILQKEADFLSRGEVLDAAQKLAALLLAGSNPTAGYQATGLSRSLASNSRNGNRVVSHPARASRYSAVHASRSSSPVMQEVPSSSPVMPEAFKSDVRELENSAIALDISVPKTLANELHMKVIAELNKDAKVPGFRPGKAPPQVLINFVGVPAVKGKTVEMIVQWGIEQSGVRKQSRVIGSPRLPVSIDDMAKDYMLGEGLDFTVEYDVTPNVNLDDSVYKGLQVEVEKVPVNMDEYEKSVDKLIEDNMIKNVKEPDTTVEMGDEVIVNMEGYFATENGTRGEKLPELANGDNLPVVMSVGKYMPGLVEGLLGAKREEKRDLAITLPKRTSTKELGNTPAIFEVEVLEIFARTRPELNDELAKKVANQSWEQLNQTLIERQEDETEANQKLATHAAIELKMAERLNFSVPVSQINGLAKERFAEMLATLREKGTPDKKIRELVTEDGFKTFKTAQMPVLTRDLKVQHALMAIAQKESIEVTRDEIDEQLMIQRTQASFKKEKFKEAEAREQTEMRLQKALVLDYILNHTEVSYIDEKDVDPDAVLGQSPEELAAALAEEFDLEK